jgi:hypothetical protein
MPEKVALLVAKIREQAGLVEGTDPALMDELTYYDLDKAYRQFTANVERALEDAKRRLEEGRMVL